MPLALFNKEVALLVVATRDLLIIDVGGIKFILLWVELATDMKPFSNNIVGDALAIYQHEAISVVTANSAVIFKHDEAPVLLVLTVDFASIHIDSVELVRLWAGVRTLSDTLLHLVVDNPLFLTVYQVSCLVTATMLASLRRNDQEIAIFVVLTRHFGTLVVVSIKFIRLR